MGARGAGLREQIADVLRVAERELGTILDETDAAALETWRVRYLGRRGRVAELFAAMSGVGPEDRPVIGRLLNDLKAGLQEKLEATRTSLGVGKRAAAEVATDTTLPGRPVWRARPHVLSLVLEEIQSIFKGLGFSVVLGPDVELDHYNFEALNFPADHPARDLQDTFYVSDQVLLRTQTSPMQVRVLETQKPPVRVIVPGRVYRNERIDASHAAEFHQVEGLYVDHDVSMADLKATVTHFLRQLFGGETTARFKPHFFPFTEPSVDVDMSCFSCHGKGCSLCDRSGWIEVMGAGMVHPNVLVASGCDPEVVTGFAFGLGVERLAMLLYGVDDIRLFLENDVRFLSQF